MNINNSEVKASVCELDNLNVSAIHDYDVVVVGAGASGVVAACFAAEKGASVALIQKEATVISQGNCSSAIIKSRSTEAGIAKWIHHTNSLCNWRCDIRKLRAYAENSEEALIWYLNRAGLTSEEEYGDGSKIDSPTDFSSLLNDGNDLFAFRSTSQDFTGLWQDRQQSYDYGDDHCYIMAPWIGPKPKNVGNVLRNILANVMAKCPALEVFYNSPAVQLVKQDGRVTGVIAKNKEGIYTQYNARNGVILATGDYSNNEAMVEHWCPDTADFDKKQFGKTGDGHIMAISAGADMEALGHTKMMHDFDSALMFEEPFLYLNMQGERFTNEYTGFVYMGNVLRNQPRYKGSHVDQNHPDGSRGWYCAIYDNSYMEWADEDFVGGKVPPFVMEKYIPGMQENPVGVFKGLIDLHRCDTLEELAKELDIPFDTMNESIKRYNALCAEGNDTDFGKPMRFMHPVVQPPFWGARKHIRVSSICSGIRTDERARALDKDGNVIPGLYCTGNLSGGFFGGADYPFHHTGLSLGQCYTFGMIAAKEVTEG